MSSEDQGIGISPSMLRIGSRAQSLIRGASVEEYTGSTLPETTRRTWNESDEEALLHFVRVCMAWTEDYWKDFYLSEGRGYIPPKTVIFRDSVRSACGLLRASVGPAYCSLDRKIYIDLSFMKELKQKFF